MHPCDNVISLPRGCRQSYAEGRRHAGSRGHSIPGLATASAHRILSAESVVCPDARLGEAARPQVLVQVRAAPACLLAGCTLALQDNDGAAVDQHALHLTQTAVDVAAPRGLISQTWPGRRGKNYQSPDGENIFTRGPHPWAGKQGVGPGYTEERGASKRTSCAVPDAWFHSSTSDFIAETDQPAITSSTHPSRRGMDRWSATANPTAGCPSRASDAWPT
eukprot:scaffold7684_cov119-Isochrysis_galbana.AAC.16